MPSTRATSLDPHSPRPRELEGYVCTPSLFLPVLAKHEPVTDGRICQQMQMGAFEDHLKDLGINPSAAVDRARSMSRGRKRSRSESPSVERSKSRGRSKTPQEEGLRDKRQKMEVEVQAKKAQRAMNKDGRKGEADRHIYNLMPKHLYAGKRGNGKTDRR
jgi:nucleolar GTP-binding protein